MKKVEAIIRRFKLDEVTRALVQLGIPGMTVTDSRGSVSSKGRLHRSSGSAEFLPKVLLELVVADEQVRPVVDTIQRVAWTGQSGDGKVFVCEILHAVRIRTGESLTMPLAASA